MTVNGFDGIDKKARPERSLVEVLKKQRRRNSYGKITVRHKGGGNRRKYRIIDFSATRRMPPAPFCVWNTTRPLANIALVEYADGERPLHPRAVGLSAGDTVVSGEGADIKPGNTLPISAIPSVR
jgi:large subunit ribosomal protein L2